MLNVVTAMGRLTRPPEIKKTPSGTSVCSFSIACDRDYSGSGDEKKTDFINCKAWRNTADFISKYFDKGSMIIVVGRLEVSSYKDKDGNSRSSVEIVVEYCYFGENKKKCDEQPKAPAVKGDINDLAQFANVHFVETSEETLPF